MPCQVRNELRTTPRAIRRHVVRSGPRRGQAVCAGLPSRAPGPRCFPAAWCFCVQIIGTVVLARLLAPRDFGVVAMVTTVSLFLSNFGLNGFTEAVLQREEINHALASNLFWINLAPAWFSQSGSPERGRCSRASTTIPW